VLAQEAVGIAGEAAMGEEKQLRDPMGGGGRIRQVTEGRALGQVRSERVSRDV
jgi:hypothetical protein